MPSYDEAFQAFSEGAVNTAIRILDASIESSYTSDHLEDILSLCCFRATLAAMEGSENISELLKPASRTSKKVQQLLTSYLEGISAMANGDFEVARLKFEAMKKEYTTSSEDGDTTGMGQNALSMDDARNRVGDHLAYLGLGAVYFHGKEYKNSFSAYRMVLETLGSRTTPKIVRVGMGLSAFCLHDPGLAKKILERELDLHPDNDLALWALLVIYVHLRMLPSVAETISKLRARLPENLMILVRVADLLYFRAIEEKSIGRSSNAIFKMIEKIRSAGTLEEKALADYHEGRMLIVLGKFADARCVLERAILILPSLLPARIHFAHLLLLSHNETNGMKELLKLNSEYPNQREVLQLLAFHLSQRGRHEAALQFCRRLLTSVAPGDIRSLALASWCSRVDEKQCLEHHSHLLKILKELSASSEECKSQASSFSPPPRPPPPLEMLANVAVLSKDVDALQKVVDETLGASFFPLVLRAGPDNSSKLASKSLCDLNFCHVPLLYNLALLKEDSDKQMAYYLYTFLAKKYCIFQEPYFRLFHMCLKDGYYQQGVQWLSLLIWITERKDREAIKLVNKTHTSNTVGASRASSPNNKKASRFHDLSQYTINLAKSFMGIAFFEHRQHKTSMELLRSGVHKPKRKRLLEYSSLTSDETAGGIRSFPDTVCTLFLAVYYLRCAQKRTKDNYRFLAEAKEQFEWVLKADQANLLAAHGLSCCLGLLDENYRCQSLLSHVSEAKPNREYVLQGNRIHLANVKARLENYKQSIDYIKKLKNRTYAQNASLAFCYAQVYEFEEAQKALLSFTDTVKETDQGETNAKEPMLLYNAAVIYFTSFLHGVKQAGAVTRSIGLELREILEKGIRIAARFFSLRSMSEETIQGVVYLKQIGQYCIDAFKQKLQPLIARGIENKRQEDNNAARWAESMACYRRQIEEKEELMRHIEEAKQADQLQARTTLRESFLHSGFSLVPAVLNQELLDCITVDGPESNTENHPVFLGEEGELSQNDIHQV